MLWTIQLYPQLGLQKQSAGSLLNEKLAQDLLQTSEKPCSNYCGKLYMFSR
jgi:hypothetical protein